VYERIQGLKQKGYSKRRAAREMNVCRDTVEKYWGMNEEEYAQCILESKSRLKILDPYRDFIVDELKKHSEITGGIIHDHLLEHFPDLRVSARATRDYVARLARGIGFAAYDRRSAIHGGSGTSARSPSAGRHGRKSDEGFFR
jgi:hypothetical protein